MEILARSRLTSKEQLSLPAAIRRLLGVRAGDEVLWVKDEEGRLLLETARSFTLDDIRAAVQALRPPRRRKPVPLAALKRGIQRHIRAKHGRG